MNFMHKLSTVLALGAFCTGVVQAAPVYSTANFSGAISSVSAALDLGLVRTNTCSGCAAGQVSGNVLFDASLEPAGGTGVFQNFALSPVDGATNAMIFQINIGGFSFVAGDPRIPAGGGPFIQYNPTGLFNGFAFADDFTAAGTDLRLRIQGNSFNIRRISDNLQLINGSIRVGASGLTDQAAFVPGGTTNVPEPASLALMGLGLAGVAALRRRTARTA